MREFARVISVYQSANGTTYLELEAPEIAKAALPGQFVHVGISKTYDPLLRRPMSLHHIDKEKGVLGILFNIVGVGTSMMGQLGEGDEADLLGPLGRGFDTDIAADTAHLVAGGIGVAPLYPLARALIARNIKVKLLVGYRTNKLFETGKFWKDWDIATSVATEDGSFGMRGFITETLKREINQGLVKHIYACGPNAMLAAVEEIAQKERIPGQVSLEAFMGCGIGACLVCACKKNGADGYYKVCSDGPVFNFGEVNIHG